MDDAKLSRVARDMIDLGLGGELRKMHVRRIAEPVNAPAFLEEQALLVFRHAARALGALPPRSAEEMREEADTREAEALGRVRAPGRKALKRLADYDREKPTLERAAKGVFEVTEARWFDTQRDKEKLLVDWKSRAGGAGEMYGRGQITWRELLAAAMLMESYELSQTSQLSGTWKVDFTEGGVQDASSRFEAAAAAWGAYRWALNRLSRAGRFLVEQRVVRGLPMEEIVRLKGAMHRIAAGEDDAKRTVRLRCDKANVLLSDALDQLADVLRIPGA